MTSPALIRRIAGATIVAAVGAGVAVATHQPVTIFFATVALGLLMFLPVGALVTHLLVPRAPSPLVRLALATGVGFALTPTMVTGLGAARALSWYLPICILLSLVWIVARAGWGSPVDPPLEDDGRGRMGGMSPSAVLLAVILLGVVAVVPLMTPLRQTAPGQFLHYAYVDDFYHLALVQSLTRSIPLHDWPSLSGSSPQFYTVYHHTVLATLSRLTGGTAMDALVVYGRLLGVVIISLLAYGIGATMTGSAWGGVLAAALQHLVLLPNIYDRNWLLNGQDMTFLPNFYQLHFYSLRYATHAISGDIITLLALLCMAVAIRSSDDRSRIGALTLAGVAAVTLFQTRGQFALVVVPAAALLQTGMLARERRALYFVPLFILVTLTIAMVAATRGPGSRADLVIRYGAFGRSAAREGYLPTIVREAILWFPLWLRPALGVSGLALLRFVGLNALALTAWGVKARAFRGPMMWFSALLAFMVAAAWLAAMFVEQRTLPGNIGMNVLTAMRMPILLLLVPPLFTLGRRLRLARPAWFARPALAVAIALIISTGIAWRGARAALMDQSERAYHVSAREFDAYRWVNTHTDPDAIVAAHPDHVVNERGEMFRSSNLLSAMTSRPVYVQRVAGLTREEGLRRTEVLRQFFDTSSAAQACAVLDTERFDYVLEWSHEPLRARPLPCLSPVYDGEPRVYRVIQRASTNSNSAQH